MKLYLTLLVGFFFSGHLYAQKQILKQLDGSQITTISVYGNTMFKIDISTKKANDIDLRLQVEGENNEQIVLLSFSKHDTLFIGSSYQPLFVPPDDKLSAHKKISIELKLEIPENLNIIIASDIASVFAKGIYNSFLAELLNGHFTSTNLSGDLLVNTIHGNINVETSIGQLELKTKNGIIKQDKLQVGKNRISLNSVNGNISVKKN